MHTVESSEDPPQTHTRIPTSRDSPIMSFQLWSVYLSMSVSSHVCKETTAFSIDSSFINLLLFTIMPIKCQVLGKCN